MTKSRIKRGIVRLMSVLRGAMLVLAFTFGSAEQIAPAQAAPVLQEGDTESRRYYFNIVMPLDPVCAGTDYQVQVSVLADITADTRDTEGRPNGRTTLNGSPRIGITVEAFAQDSEVGTLDPEQLITGWGEPLNDTDRQVATSDRRGEVSFKFHAKKAGTTKLYFEASVGGKYISSEASIKVVNCKYKVGMNILDVDSREGVTIWASGDMNIEIEGEGGEMTGSGNLVFVSGFVGPPCTITYSEFQNPTTITGQVNDNDQLTLQFDYEPGTITSNVSCLDVTASASHSIDMTNTGITSATFATNGGTHAFSFTYAGSDMAPGTMIINVEPVVEDEGGPSS